MSVITETFIICDGGCGNSYGVDNRLLAGWEHRKKYWQDGWMFRNGKDWCPECRKRFITNSVALEYRNKKTYNKEGK